MHAFAQKPKATQHITSAKSTAFNRTHFGQNRDPNSILHLQRTLGNQAVQRLSEANAVSVKGNSTTSEIARFGHDFSRMPRPADHCQVATKVGQHQLPAPRIKIAEFSASRTPKVWLRNDMSDKSERDKSVTPSTEDQDQSAALSSLVATANGVSITVEPVGVYSSNEFPDGFRWTQTITTNADRGGPLLVTPISFTDPKPNDDAKPFYWTDAEEIQHKGTFQDTPSRKPRPGGAVTWDAILSLNGVNGKTVTRFDSLGYGFSVDSGGTVTQHGPMTPADVSDHLSTLRTDFPDWTFN